LPKQQGQGLYLYAYFFAGENMNREDIIRMATEVGFSEGEIDTCQLMLERFAALVASAEREACAKVCEERIGGAVQTNDWWFGFRSAMKQCATAIRARGQA
jgi:hypothetical protein